MGRFGLLRAIALRLRPNDAATAYLELRVAAALATPYALIFPAALPTSQQAFTVDASGNVSWQPLTGGGGTVTSFSATSTLFDVVTPSTTPALSFKSQAQNLVLASPNGAAGAPAFRSIVAADIPKTLDNSWITDFDTRVRTSRLDQFASPTASVNFNSQRLTGLADPTALQDAATKNYVDTVAQGLDAKQSVRVASTGNVTLSAPGTTIDSVTLNTGDRVLLKNQTAPAENGIYLFNGSAAAMTRTADMDAGVEFPSSFVFVEEGTINADTGWTCLTNAPITLGTTAISFTQFSGAGSIGDGNGLVRTGNVLDVVGTANRIIANANSIDIDAAYAGQSSITTLGTVTTGTWSGTPIAVNRGGTGATDAAAARANLAVSGVFRGTFTSSTGSTGITVASNVVTISHGLGQKVVDVTLADPNGKRIFPDDVTYTNTTSLQLDLSVITIGAGTYEVLISG